MPEIALCLSRRNRKGPAAVRAIVYTEPGAFSVQDVPERPLRPREVRVENDIVGVCGTDQHLHAGEFNPVYPLTPGHEMAGRVVEAGPDVTELRAGDRVAIDNTIYCMRCANCKRGDFNFCLNGVALGVQAPGGFAERTIASADKVYSIGDLPLDAAAIIEPASCVVHGLDVLALKPGADVLIIGAGPTGQILAQLIIHGGASRVTMAAPTQFKLKVAESHGVNETVLLDRHDFTASFHRFQDIAPLGFDVVVEATGAIPVLDHVISLVRSGGTLMIYGMAKESKTIRISPFEVFRREIQIKGSFAQSYGFARAIDLLRAGKVDPTGFITHRYALEDYGKALEALRAQDCLKAVIEPGR
jgi:D-arabinitol dehydrogenase (NADP+)